jgi:endonuclease/exonuclease/phosphatase family metal-dependent hydrolase
VQAALRSLASLALTVSVGLVAAGCGDAPIASGKTVTVMSYNIYLGGRIVVPTLEPTVEAIRAAGADVVGLQEQIGSAEEIAAMLGYDVVVQSLSVAYLSRLPIVETGAFGIVVELCPGVTATVADVHLAPYPYGPYDIRDFPNLTDDEVIATARIARGSATQEVLDFLAPDLAAGSPTFLVGDFNEPSYLDWTPETAAAGLHFGRAIQWPTSLLVAGAGLTDVYRRLVPDPVEFPAITWTPLPGPDEVFDRIDFVYYAGDGVAPTDVAIVGESSENANVVVDPWPSDHRAVAASFRVAACAS